MRKSIIVIIFLFSTQILWSQAHQININSCNIYFNDFSNRKVYFPGISSDLSFLFSRFSMDISIRYCFPKTYYGIARSYVLTKKEDKEIFVYSKGGIFSIAYSFTYKFLKPKSERYYLGLYSGFNYLNHTGKFNSENFIRIYGGYDDISLSFISLHAGLRYMYRFGYIPIVLNASYNIPVGKREFNSFLTSSFLMLEAGIALPIIKCPPADKIYKLNY